MRDKLARGFANVGYWLFALTIMWHVYLVLSGAPLPNLEAAETYRVNSHGIVVYVAWWEYALQYVLFFGSLVSFLLWIFIGGHYRFVRGNQSMLGAPRLLVFIAAGCLIIGLTSLLVGFGLDASAIGGQDPSYQTVRSLVGIAGFAGIGGFMLAILAIAIFQRMRKKDG